MAPRPFSLPRAVNDGLQARIFGGRMSQSGRNRGWQIAPCTGGQSRGRSRSRCKRLVSESVESWAGPPLHTSRPGEHRESCGSPAKVPQSATLSACAYFRLKSKVPTRLYPHRSAAPETEHSFPLCEQRQRLAKLPSEMQQRRASLVYNPMPKALKTLWSQPAQIRSFLSPRGFPPKRTRNVHAFSARRIT
jgi:hypothetical protein